MIIKSTTRGLLTGILLGIAGVFSAQASSTFITFSVDLGTNIANGTFTEGVDTVAVAGSFNNWSQFGLVEEGSSTIYTNTIDDTSDANGAVMGYKFYTSNTSGGETTADYNNRGVVLPTTSGASLILPTPFYGDDGAHVTNEVTFQVDMSQQINIGAFTNGSSTVTVNGNFNGWTGAEGVLAWTPSISETNGNGLVTSNVYTGTFNVAASPNAAMDYKYVENNNYEGTPIVADGGNNRFFMMPNAPETIPVVFYNDNPYSPVCQTTFSVDMSAQLYYGFWTPSDVVYCQGINGDWNDDAVNTMTNNPGASNTNIYYATFTLGQGSSSSYKFAYYASGVTNYESPASTGGNNRTYTVPSVGSVDVPTVYFSDLSVDDLLTSNIQVTFSVDMSQAVQDSSGPSPGATFDPNSDYVFVNGAWLGWLSWSPEDLISYQMTNNTSYYPSNTMIYSGQFSIPLGTSLGMTYKYSIDGYDDEAGSGDNHVRYVRSTATGAYSFPVDTFGNQYNEPSFGQLAVAPAPAVGVQLSWLGAPNVEVQTSTNLGSKTWVSQPETSGVTWSAGTNSVNGLVSVTNWPAGGGNVFFRLIKQ
jgi:hypothetical protein